MSTEKKYARSLHGTFIGSPNSKRKRLLKGKTAMLREDPNPEYILAQFDDRDTGLGYNWHRFPKSYFTLDQR